MLEGAPAFSFRIKASAEDTPHGDTSSSSRDAFKYLPGEWTASICFSNEATATYQYLPRMHWRWIADTPVNEECIIKRKE